MDIRIFKTYYMNFKLFISAIFKNINQAQFLVLFLPIVFFTFAKFFGFETWLLIIALILLVFALFLLVKVIIPDVISTYTDEIDKIEYAKFLKLSEKNQKQFIAKNPKSRVVKKVINQFKKEAAQKHRQALKDEVDKKLSLEKKVKCDDGITRVYNGFMWGIIKCDAGTKLINEKGKKFGVDTKGNNGYFNVYEIIPDNYSEFVQKRKFNNSLFEITDEPSKEINNYKFDLNIRTEKWFSENGISLSIEEIFAKDKQYFKMKNEYNKRWSNTRVLSNPRLINTLICINGYFFRAVSHSPISLFSGTIDGIKIKNGQLKGKYFNDQSSETIEEYNENVSKTEDENQPNDQNQEIHNYDLGVKLNLLGFELTDDITVFNVDQKDIELLVDHWSCEKVDGEDEAYYVYFEWGMLDEIGDFGHIFICQHIYYGIELDIVGVSGTFTIYEYDVWDVSLGNKSNNGFTFFVFDEKNNIVDLTENQLSQIDDLMDFSSRRGEYSYGVFTYSDWDKLPENYFKNL